MAKDNPLEATRILITAPFPAMRAGLRSLVESDPGIQVIAECAGLSEWGSHISNTDVILLAPVGPMSNGFLEQVEASSSNRPLLFLVSQPLTSRPPLGSRAWGVLSLTASSDQILLAIRALSQGYHLAQPDLMPQDFRNDSKLESSEEIPVEPLTRREMEVLQHLALGLTNKEIARKLKISPETVKYHSSSIYTKLGASSRTEAVRLGLKLGWVNL